LKLQIDTTFGVIVVSAIANGLLLPPLPVPVAVLRLNILPAGNFQTTKFQTTKVDNSGISDDFCVEKSIAQHQESDKVAG
jgi:hypothetical protein